MDRDVPLSSRLLPRPEIRGQGFRCGHDDGRDAAGVDRQFAYPLDEVRVRRPIHRNLESDANEIFIFAAGTTRGNARNPGSSHLETSNCGRDRGP